ANQMPARIFPPGKVPSYSNYGFTLAGYIVERISGEKFERYVENHILKPLGMNSSTFDQPLPPQLAPQMSKVYLNATQKPRDFEFVEAAPVGYFISYNSLGKNVGGGRGEVQRAFMNRYFPTDESKSEIDPSTAKTDGRSVSGVYEGTRRSETTFLRFVALMDQFSVKSDK